MLRRPPGPGSEKTFHDFPELKVISESDFAHDRGTVTKILDIEVGGVSTKLKSLDAALPFIIKHRKGWSEGSFQDTDVIRVVQQWIAVLSKGYKKNVATECCWRDDELEGAVLFHDSEEDMIRLFKRPNMPEPKTAVFSLPTTEIVEHEGKKLVIHSYWYRETCDSGGGRGGSHGNRYGPPSEKFDVVARRKYAFEVQTGKQVPPPTPPTCERFVIL